MIKLLLYINGVLRGRFQLKLILWHACIYLSPPILKITKIVRSWYHCCPVLEHMSGVRIFTVLTTSKMIIFQKFYKIWIPHQGRPTRGAMRAMPPPGPLRGGALPPPENLPLRPPWKLKDQRILIYLTSMAKILYTLCQWGQIVFSGGGKKNFARAPYAFKNISFHFAPPWRNLVGRPWV